MRKLIIALILASPAWAQTAIQGWAAGQGYSAGINPTVTLTGCATHQAYLLVAITTNNGASATTTGISSTSIPAGSWHYGANVNPAPWNGNNDQMAIAWAYSTSVSNTEVITETNAWNSPLAVQCFSGAAPSPRDQASTNACGTSSFPVIHSCFPGTLTPTEGGELIVAGSNTDTVVSFTSVDGGFTPSVALGTRLAEAYLIQTTPAAANPTFSWTGTAWSSADVSMSFFALAPPVDYTATGPASGYIFSPSTAFTVTKATGNFTGTQTIVLSDGAQGGTFTPSVGSSGVSTVTVTPGNGTNSFTFTYTPVQAATILLTFSGTGMSGENAPSLAYTSTPITITDTCTSYTGVLGTASSTCTVTITGTVFNGSRYVALSDTGESPSGTFIPSVGSPFSGAGNVTPSSGNSFTYTYTPTGPVGSRLISLTNSFQGTNPANITLAATSADACAFTAKASGNWNAAGTWNTPTGCTGGGHAIPTAGDSASVTGYTVTCSTGTCYLGTAPANNTTYNLTIANSGATNGVVEVSAGATLWLTGNFNLNGSNGATSGGKLIVDTGGSFIHDNNNSATVSYRGQAGANNQLNWIQFGTKGDACTITGAYTSTCPTAYTGVNIAGGVYPQLVNPTNYNTVAPSAFGTAFTNCGSASLHCIEWNITSNFLPVTMDIEGSVFNRTNPFGAVDSNNTPCSTCVFTWVGNRMVNSIAGFEVGNTHGLFQHPSSCTISSNYFEGVFGNSDNYGNCAMTYNVFSDSIVLAPIASPNAFKQFDSNLIMATQAEANVDMTMFIPAFGNMLLSNMATTGSAHMSLNQSGTAYTLVGTLGDKDGIATESVCAGQVASNNTTHKATLLDNLSVMTSAGDSGCRMLGTYVTVAGQVGNNFYADHNGGNGNNVTTWFGYYGHSGTYYQTNVAFEALRANLGWSPSSGANNRLVYDGGASGGQPTTTADATTIIDWNDAYNSTASVLFPSSTLNGTAYQINSTVTTVGTHERGVGATLAAADPKYIDTGRRFDTWASRVMGQAASFTGVKAAFWSCQDISYCLGSAYNWIRRGWQPTNMALRGSAHDGKIIGFSGTYGSGYSGTCGVTFTPQDAWDLGGSIALYTASALCTFDGSGVPQITIVNGGRHYRITTPATVTITCGGCTPSVAASLTPIIQPSDIGPVDMVVIAGVAY